MRRTLGGVVLVVLAASCAPAPQRVSYPGAVKGNRAVGRYFGASATDAFHWGDEGLVHFDGSSWTPVPGFDGTSSAQVISAGGGKVWALDRGRLERVDAAGTREDFTAQVSLDGAVATALGGGNGELFVCSGKAATSEYALFRLVGEGFQKVLGSLPAPVTFELVRGPDDVFVASTFPTLSLQVFPTFAALPTRYGSFDGASVSGPLSVVGDPLGLATAFSSVSPRLPKAFGVLGEYVFDGAWLHRSQRPPPGGQFYLRADGRLGVLANLYGAGGFETAYAVSYDPATGQYTSQLLDVNGEVDVTYWAAAWDGAGWVDAQELFHATACIGATCGGSRTAYAGELDDGTMVVSGLADDVSGVWFIKP